MTTRRLAAVLALVGALVPAGPVGAQAPDPAARDALAATLTALAADVFRELTQTSGADATAMAQTLDRASADPPASRPC